MSYENIEFRYWQSVANGWWYWHLLDTEGEIRAIGGQKFSTAQGAIDEIKAVFAMLGGTRNIPITKIADPNAA